MPGVPSVEQLTALVETLSARNAELERIVSEQAVRIAAQADRIAELERRLGANSSNSSRPPSSDAPWNKPARKRSSRIRSGRKPGKQPGAPGISRRLRDDPNQTLLIEPHHCGGCGGSLAAAGVHGCERRQVVDTPQPPPLEITEYQRISKSCPGCGTVTTPSWDDDAVPAMHAETLAAPGSPVSAGIGRSRTEARSPASVEWAHRVHHEWEETVRQTVKLTRLACQRSELMCQYVSTSRRQQTCVLA